MFRAGSREENERKLGIVGREGRAVASDAKGDVVGHMSGLVQGYLCQNVRGAISGFHS
jgi:hypothetical protein